MLTAHDCERLYELAEQHQQTAVSLEPVIMAAILSGESETDRQKDAIAWTASQVGPKRRLVIRFFCGIPTANPSLTLQAATAFLYDYSPPGTSFTTELTIESPSHNNWSPLASANESLPHPRIQLPDGQHVDSFSHHYLSQCERG